MKLHNGDYKTNSFWSESTSDHSKDFFLQTEYGWPPRQSVAVLQRTATPRVMGITLHQKISHEELALLPFYRFKWPQFTILPPALLVQSSHAQAIKGRCADNVAVSTTFSLSSFASCHREQFWVQTFLCWNLIVSRLDCWTQKVNLETCSWWLDKINISSRAPNIFTPWHNPKKGNTQTCLQQISFQGGSCSN